MRAAEVQRGRAGCEKIVEFSSCSSYDCGEQSRSHLNRESYL